MAAFITAELGIDEEAAHALRRRFLLAHGTTLRGLMLEHAIEPARFLDYVHAVDMSPVPPDPVLVEAIAALPGRKLIFTNATRAYAERILDRIGFDAQFLAIHDIAACDFRPKPDPSGYAALVARYDIDPRRALMIEDMARNLPPAAALGMTTAWVRGSADWAQVGQDSAHIHHVVDELAPWLAAAAQRREKDAV
jgi:putative hydrolase of the HAD superfamily